MRAGWVALAGLLALACGGEAPRAPSPAPAEPALVLADVGADATTMEPPPGAPLVFTPSAVRRGGGPPLLALERGRFPASAVRGGEHGYLVEALSPAVATAEGEALVLAFEPSIPYATVTRAIYTAGQAGTVNVAFLVQSDGRTGALPILIPRLGAEPASSSAFADVLAQGAVGPFDEDPGGAASVPGTEPDAVAPAAVGLDLALSVSPAGIGVRGSGGWLAPGCEIMGSSSAPAVPESAGAPDLAALRACLRRVKRQFPDETNVLVEAEPATPFEALARVVGAARGTATETLFPDVSLGLPAR